MKENISWETVKIKIKDLVPHERNPRSLSEKTRKELLKSFEQYNYVELIVINTEGKILAGHQRIKILHELGRGEEEIEVRKPSRKLTKKEEDSYLILSNKISGEWDFDIMKSMWDLDEVLELGFTKEEVYGKDEVLPSEDDLDVNEEFIVEIKCDSQEHQQRIYEEFTKRGLACRILTL